MSDIGSTTDIPLDAAETRLRRAYWLILSTRYIKQAFSLLTIVMTVLLVIYIVGFTLMQILGPARPGSKVTGEIIVLVFLILTTALYYGLLVGIYFFDAATRSFALAGGVVWAVLAGVSLLTLFLPGGPFWLLLLPSALDRVLASDAAGLRGFITVMLVAVIAFQAYLVWVLYRGIRAYFDVPANERRLLKEPAPGISRRGRVLIQFWGLPPTFEYVRRPRRRQFALIVLAFLQSAAFGMATLFAVFLPSSWLSASAFCTGANCKVGVVDLLLPVLFTPLAIVLLALAGAGAQRAVQRLVRLSLTELQTTDTRAPILFLRSFQDDRLALPAPRLALPPRLLEFGRKGLRLEHLLLEEGTYYGPVVALGDPGDPYPSYGAAKGYFDNTHWQDAVAKIARDARAIVISLNVTESIWWEIGHVVSSGHLRKTLFLLRPADAASVANAAQVERLQKAIGGPVAVVPAVTRTQPASVIAVYLGDDGILRVVRSATFSRFAYLLALRQFLRDKFGVLPFPKPVAASAAAGRRDVPASQLPGSVSAPGGSA